MNYSMRYDVTWTVVSKCPSSVMYVFKTGCCQLRKVTVSISTYLRRLSHSFPDIEARLARVVVCYVFYLRSTMFREDKATLASHSRIPRLLIFFLLTWNFDFSMTARNCLIWREKKKSRKKADIKCHGEICIMPARNGEGFASHFST